MAEGPASVSKNGEALAEGLMSVLRPVVGELDDQVEALTQLPDISKFHVLISLLLEVKATRQSQIALRSQMDSLAEELRAIADAEASALDLQPYAKKLSESRKRVAVVASILGNAQERLGRLQQIAAKETARRKAALEPPLPNPPPAL